MTESTLRKNTVTTRLNDAEYAAFLNYMAQHPDFEDNESVALRRLIVEYTAAAQPATANKATAKKEKAK